MHKLKITLLSLLGICTIFITIIAYIFSSYENQDYQQLLIKVVDNFSDYTLSINGPFDLHRSLSPTLSVSAIELQSKTDKSYIHIDKFKIQFSLAPLLSNTLLINDFLLENMRIDIQTREDAKRDVNLINYLPVVIIEHAVLNNVQLILDSDTQVYTLDRFVIAANDRQSPLEVHGAGKLKGYGFEINGNLGPIDDIYTQDRPYPVNLTANWHQAQLSINGTIQAPYDGEGVDLVGEIEIPEVADILAKKMPLKGRLHGKFHIKGDLDELALVNIQAGILNKQLMKLQVTGSIGNLLTQEQTGLHLSGFVHDAGFLKWVMPDNSPHFHSLKIDADINKGRDEYILHSLNINLSNKQLKIDLTGNAHIVQQAQPFRSLELQAEISSKDTVTVNPYLGGVLPEMGPVKGSVRIRTQNKGFVLSNIDLLAGVDKKIQLSAKGRVFWDTNGDISQIALNLALKAKHSSELTSFLEIEHPEIGPVAITSSLKGSSKKLMLEGFKLKAGNKDVYLIQADGGISWDKLNTDSPVQLVDLTVHAHAPSFQDAARLYGEYVPDLGPAKISMRIHGTGMVLAGSDFTMQLGTKNSLLFMLRGNIAQMFIADAFHQGIDLTGTLTGKSTSYLSELLENSKIPDIGPLSGKLMITGDSNNLQIPQISLSAGRKNHLMLTAAGKIAEVPLRQQLPPRGVDIALAVTAPGSKDLSMLLGNEVPDLGRLLIKGRLTDQKGIYAIEDLILTAGNPKQPVISISGSVEDVLSANKLQMKVLFDEKTLVKLFDLRSIPELGPLKGSAVLSNAEGSFSLKDLKLESGNSELIDFKINGAIEDVAKTKDISINADISIKNPELFGKLFTADFSGVKPISASGHISGNKTKVTFKGNALVGKTRFSNDFAVSFINEKTKISGIINSPELFLKDFGVISEISATKSSKKQKQRIKSAKAVLFSHTQLPLQILHKVDLDLKLRIARLTGRDYHFDRVNIDLLLQNSKLTASPVNFVYSEGNVLMNVEIDAVDAIGKPEWSVNMQANNVQLGEVFWQKDTTPPIEGEFNLVADLKSSGISEHMIASNLNGDIGFTLENGGINRSSLELVFLNPLGWIFSHGINDNEFSITCGLANYQIKQGVIRSQVFLIDGPKLLVRGKTEVNLPRETVNSFFNLEKKNIFIPSFATTSVPIKISGKLINPTIEQAHLSSIKSNADRYIFAPVATVPRELIGTVFDIFKEKKDVQSPCKVYLKN